MKCTDYLLGIRNLLSVNPLNAELNPICHLIALAGAHHFVDVSSIRVNDLKSSPNIVRVIKSGRLKWAWHVAIMKR
jgi:hypothetical protein